MPRERPTMTRSAKYSKFPPYGSLGGRERVCIPLTPHLASPLSPKGARGEGLNWVGALPPLSALPRSGEGRGRGPLRSSGRVRCEGVSRNAGSLYEALPSVGHGAAEIREPHIVVVDQAVGRTLDVDDAVADDVGVLRQQQ